jgi:hypothetical protein
MIPRQFLLGNVVSATKTPLNVLKDWVSTGFVPRAGEDFSRDEVAYAAVVAQLVRFGLSPSVAAKTMKSATDDQPEYWRHAIDSALCESEVNLFFKKYTYGGQDYVEAELFVAAPKPGEHDPDKWVALATGLEARREAFADGTRAGTLSHAERSEAPPDPVVTFEIGSTIAAALRALPQ